MDFFSHSGHAPAMTISDPYMISKWENLQNSRVFKYLFSSLYICYTYDFGLIKVSKVWNINPLEFTRKHRPKNIKENHEIYIYIYTVYT